MARQFSVYFGTYTGPQSRGIYRSFLDRDTGELTAPVCVAEAKNPSFLALHPNGQFLYAALDGAVGAWAIGEGATLTELNQRPSGGSDTCHVSVDAAGKNVLIASYGSGTIAAFPLQSDGSLGECSSLMQHTGSGPNPHRQEKAHAHSVYADPSNRFVYACDLGTDEVKIYRLDAQSGVLQPNDPPAASVPPGAGPRHFALHPHGFAYANNEMGLSVTAFERNAETGALNPIQTVPTLPEGTSTHGASTAEMFIHPSGRWLYVSNRGANTITAYTIGSDGKLSWLERANTPNEPRGFGISPDGEWLIVGGQNDNTVRVFRVNVTTGKLTALPQTVEVGTPICVLFAD